MQATGYLPQQNQLAKVFGFVYCVCMCFLFVFFYFFKLLALKEMFKFFFNLLALREISVKLVAEYELKK